MQLLTVRTQAEMGHTCRGTINLATASITVDDACNFVISNGGAQTYHLKASCEVERQRWITALELAKAKAARMQAESGKGSILRLWAWNIWGPFELFLRSCLHDKQMTPGMTSLPPPFKRHLDKGAAPRVQRSSLLWGHSGAKLRTSAHAMISSQSTARPFRGQSLSSEQMCCFLFPMNFSTYK